MSIRLSHTRMTHYLHFGLRHATWKEDEELLWWRLCSFAWLAFINHPVQWKTLQSTCMWSKLIVFFTRKLFQVCTSIFLLACERVSFWLEGSISYRDSPDLQLCVDCFLISIRDPSKWQRISNWHRTIATQSIRSRSKHKNIMKLTPMTP